MVLNMGCKLVEIFQTIQGWCIAVCVFVANFFAGYETAINAVIVCVALDTIWGIAAQIKRGISRYPSSDGAECSPNSPYTPR